MVLHKAIRKLKFYLRFIFTIFLYFFKFTPFQLKKNQSLISVINYHYFLGNDVDPLDPSLEININVLRKQLLILLNTNKFIKNSKELSYFFNKKTIDKKFLITIDDADYNIKKILPIIKELKIPIILFIPFGFCLDKDNIIGLQCRYLHHLYFKLNKDNKKINNKKILLENFNQVMRLDRKSLQKKYLKLIKDSKSFFVKKKFLSIKDLKNISDNNLITLASHSMTHLPLKNLPNKWLKWEITESIKLVKKVKGDYKIFAYPYGHVNSYNSNVKKMLFNHNIKFAFSTRSFLLNQNTDPLELGRTYFFNNSNRNYILGTAFGSMQLFDNILKR